MQFWNVIRYAKRLRDGEVGAYERAVALFINMIMIALFTSNYMTHVDCKTFPEECDYLSIYGYLEDILAIVMTGVTIILAYCINQQGDGREFVDRYMCLSIPLLVQVFAAVVVIGIFTAGTHSYLILFLSTTLIGIYYTVMLLYAMRIASTPHYLKG